MSGVERIVEHSDLAEIPRREVAGGHDAVFLTLREHGFSNAAARRFVHGPIATVVKATAEYRGRLQRRRVSQASAYEVAVLADCERAARAYRTSPRFSAYEVAVLADGETGAMVGPLQFGDAPGRVAVSGHVRYVREHPGVYVTAHVHPNDYPVTPADVRLFLASPWLRSLIVLEGKSTWYVVTADPSVARPDAGLVAATYEGRRASPSLSRITNAALAAGFGARRAAMIAHHVLLTQVATIFGLRYNEVHG